MSNAPLRRTDKQMDDARLREFLTHGYCGRLATVGADGWPYVVPLLFVWMNEQIYTHNSQARGHLRNNLEHEPRVCFEIDQPSDVFAYGRFECDTSLSYASLVAFGTIRIVEDREEKIKFCSALMAKYAPTVTERPKDFFPRLDHIAVYAMRIERMTGKETPLPAVSEQWPARDRTKTPAAVPPTK